VTLPIVDTPIGWPIPDVPERSDRWNAALAAAFYRPANPSALAKLEDPRALVVTTGQQPGLFTGPSYSITKALSARGLALALERRWKRPVVPVYWVPGDDHDWQEATAASWISFDGTLCAASLPPRPAEAPLTPMAREPLGAAVLPALDEFQNSFSETPEGSATVEWLRRHYTPTNTVAGAYGTALAELLGPLGILCIDTTHPAVKQAAAPLLLQALERADELDQRLESQDRELKKQGVDAGVAVGDRASLVFLDTELGRDRIVSGSQSDPFQLRRTKATLRLEALEELLRNEPTRFSANVLLRPVLESALLPTVAYVAGPGELKYLELAAPLYEALGVFRQVPVPRWSGLLVEPRVTRLLNKYGISIEELLTDGSLERRIARQSFPEGTDAALARLRQTVDESYGPVIRAAAAIDPTMERPADAARRQALFAVDELEKKLIQHARRRESVELSQVARARLSVRPHGKPQERVLTMSGFLARYGDSVLTGLADHIARWYG
jgi:bacillithiol biosynthesis cysteine-adding enzyme BshC